MKRQLDRVIGRLAYYLWDKKQGGVRLKEMGNLAREQWLPPETIEQLQVERTRHLLTYAEKNSPYYRELFSKHQFDVSTFSQLSDLHGIPVTTKADIRDNIDSFISDEYSKDELATAKTGGSTGISLDLFFDEVCQQKRNAAQGLSDGWAGWKPGSRVAALWGNPPTYTRLKAKLRSYLLERMIYLDTMSMNDGSVQNFAKHCEAFQPDILFGHAHSIYLFAKYVAANDIPPFKFKGIIATSMMLLDHERKLIEEVFGTKVSNRYGCEEVGLIACECEQHQGMHINSSHIVLECLDANDQPVPNGEAGKLVVTDLNNFGMPLIRYRVEDMGVLSDRACDCGRGLPILERLEGRLADFLKNTDGTQIAGVSLVERTLTKIPGVEQMQLVQERKDQIIVNRVKGKEFTEKTDALLLEELQSVFNEDVSFIIVDKDKIPQEQSGKYRFSICKV